MSLRTHKSKVQSFLNRWDIVVSKGLSSMSFDSMLKVHKYTVYHLIIYKCNGKCRLYGELVYRFNCRGGDKFGEILWIYVGRESYPQFNQFVGFSELVQSILWAWTSADHLILPSEIWTTSHIILHMCISCSCSQFRAFLTSHQEMHYLGKVSLKYTLSKIVGAPFI